MTRTQIIALYVQENLQKEQAAGILRMAQIAVMTKEERIQTLSSWIDSHIRIIDESVAQLNEQLVRLQAERDAATNEWKAIL